MTTQTIRVNQYRDGISGHVNISFIDSTTNVTYGNNLSPSSGVQNETAASAQRIANSPSTYSYTDFSVSEQDFQRALAVAQVADVLNNNWSGLCNNCVDFANEILKSAGFGDWSIANILQPGSLTAEYAKAAEAICSNQYVNEATSRVLDALGSASNLLDMQRFVESMTWLSYPQGDPFYSTYSDPDAEADWHLSRMQYLGKKMGIDVYWDPIKEKVMLGVASPIAIDLDGDGIKTISYAASQVLFDIDGDGIKDKTAWISSDDAFVAIDKNANGKIDGVNELFGGLARGQGFAELQEVDSNHDGVVDSLDADFGKLLLWRDANSDGITDEGELTSLSARGVTSLSVQYTTQEVYDANGNLHGETSTAVVNGVAVAMSDIYFKYRRYGGATEEDLELVRQTRLPFSSVATFTDISDTTGLTLKQPSSADLLSAYTMNSDYQLETSGEREQSSCETQGTLRKFIPDRITWDEAAIKVRPITNSAASSASVMDKNDIVYSDSSASDIRAQTLISAMAAFGATDSSAVLAATTAQAHHWGQPTLAVAAY